MLICEAGRSNILFFHLLPLFASALPFPSPPKKHELCVGDGAVPPQQHLRRGSLVKPSAVLIDHYAVMFAGKIRGDLAVHSISTTEFRQTV